MSRGRRRVYAEHVPWSALDGPLLRALAQRDIELALAVFPTQRHMLPALARRLRSAGILLTVWPLLADHEGRWPSAHNAASFATHALSLANALPEGRLLFDLEPPIGWTRALLAGRPGPLPRRDATTSHAELLARLRRAGWALEAVVPPMLLYGVRWERWLGTSADAFEDAQVEPMAYTSLFEGYSRGVVSRPVARDLLARITRQAASSCASPSVALGVVGGGALGNERAYRNVEELREDVATALGTGARSLSLYSLDGILARPPIEPWLDAFCVTEAASPHAPTRRGAALEAMLRALS